ncbi:MAG: adenine deaminase [Thermodesulfobacteriota bacterium]|nr:adenine deaminase [Thermodesulfobacteriota bacterium]
MNTREMIESLKRRVLAARGEIPADIVLKGGDVVNLFSGEAKKGDVALYEGVIVGAGPGYRGKEEVDVAGKWIAPGLIDGHLHIESSMLIPSAIAQVLLLRGTTAIVADPHEIANVMGLSGIRFMLEDSEKIPFDLFFMAPSCVPATHLETNGARLGVKELKELRKEPRILGLAEMMNFPGVLAGDEEVLEKIIAFRDRAVDGHGPSLRGHDLQAYIAAGIRSDHETTELSEAAEKLESGMMIMIREGSSAKNLETLLPLVNDKNAHRFCFVSDDLNAEDIKKRGHLDFMIKRAIEMGMDPIIAIRMCTLNPAEYFGLRGKGAIAPGYDADLVILDDLEDFSVSSVYKGGRKIVEEGALILYPHRGESGFHRKDNLLNIRSITPKNFRIPCSNGKARIIEIVPGEIVTRVRYETPRSRGGFVVSDKESDILKLCVVERHRGSGRIGLGLVKGFGLNQGAMASSIAHDSHNIIAVGVSDEEIFRAVEELRLMGGGLAVICGEETLAKVPLPIGGLMSAEPVDRLLKQLKALNQSAVRLGCHIDNPFMALSFLALPVIPELKLTDRGLVDINRFEIVPLFCNA